MVVVTTEAPEATDEKVQPTPEAPSDPRDAAKAAATEELGREPQEAPEATLPEGTAAGDDDAPDSADDEPETSEVDWTDPDARAKAIREDVETATARVKQSFKGELEVAEAQRNDATLLKELEELETSNPAALNDKLKNNAEAARVFSTSGRGDVNTAVASAVGTIVTQTRAAMAAVVPDIGEMSDDDWAAFSAEMGSRKGGGFAYVAEKAVEVFKQSSEYTEAIKDAETRGKQDAAGDLGTPPPSDDEKSPPGSPMAELPADPRQRAAAMANRQLKRVDFDASRVQPARKRSRAG